MVYVCNYSENSAWLGNVVSPSEGMCNLHLKDCHCFYLEAAIIFGLAVHCSGEYSILDSQIYEQEHFFFIDDSVVLSAACPMY